jgi:hypothetical protein
MNKALVIGFVVIGGAVVVWFLTRHAAVTAASNGAGSNTSASLLKVGAIANAPLTLGYESLKFAGSVGEKTAIGALHLGGDVINGTTKVLTTAVNVGGTLVADTGKVTAKVANLASKVVVTTGYEIPKAVAYDIPKTVVVGVGKDVVSGAKSVVNGTVSGAEKVGSAIGGGVSTAIKTLNPFNW